MNVVDNNGGSLTERCARIAISLMIKDKKLADYVIMNPLQKLAVLNCFTEVLHVTKWEPSTLPEAYEMTFMGLKVVLDPLFPKDAIELRDKDDKVLVRIKNLAVPIDPRGAAA